MTALCGTTSARVGGFERQNRTAHASRSPRRLGDRRARAAGTRELEKQIDTCRSRIRGRRPRDSTCLAATGRSSPGQALRSMPAETCPARTRSPTYTGARIQSALVWASSATGAPAATVCPAAARSSVMSPSNGARSAISPRGPTGSRLTDSSRFRAASAAAAATARSACASSTERALADPSFRSCSSRCARWVVCVSRASAS